MSDRTENGSITCEHIIDSSTKALSRFRSIEVVQPPGGCRKSPDHANPY